MFQFVVSKNCRHVPYFSSRKFMLLVVDCLSLICSVLFTALLHLRCDPVLALRIELRLPALTNQKFRNPNRRGSGHAVAASRAGTHGHDGDNSSAKAPNPHAPPLENRSVSRNLPRKAAQIISAPGHLGALALLPAICYPRGQQTKRRACDRCRHCMQ